MSEPASLGDAVKTAFLDSIRSVILIDDEFPRYDTLVTNRGSGLNARLDPERAKALWAFCRARNLACDVEDGSEIDVATGAVPSHIGNSDLIVLDFHLDGRDTAKSLYLLTHLATSPHANLVVVYTNEPDLKTVQLRAAATLRGARSAQALVDSIAVKLGEEAERDKAWDAFDVETFSPTEQSLRRAITLERGWAKDADVRKQIEASGVQPKWASKLIEPAVESYLASRLVGGAPTTISPRLVRLSAPEAEHFWVQSGNVFVTFLQKSTGEADVQNEGGRIFDALRASLTDCFPNFLPRVLAYARGEIARRGLELGAEVLSDPTLQVGWLYHALSGSPDEKVERYRALFERLLGRLNQSILAAVERFGHAHMVAPGSPDGDAQVLRHARGLVGLPDEFADDQAVLHKLNEFLACEPVGTYIRTGTIFRQTGKPGDEAWVCMTPECDMVPRPVTGGWRGKLHPVRPVMAVAVRVRSVNPNHLATATTARALFLTLPDKTRVVLELVDDVSREPKPEVMFVENQGLLEGAGTFKAHRITGGQNGPPSSQTVEMEAIGQMRAIYANRMLQQTGHHLARIGVDFVNLPQQSPNPDGGNPPNTPAA